MPARRRPSHGAVARTARVKRRKYGAKTDCGAPDESPVANLFKSTTLHFSDSIRLPRSLASPGTIPRDRLRHGLVASTPATFRIGSKLRRQEFSAVLTRSRRPFDVRSDRQSEAVTREDEVVCKNPTRSFAKVIARILVAVKVSNASDVKKNNLIKRAFPRSDQSKDDPYGDLPRCSFVAGSATVLGTGSLADRRDMVKQSVVNRPVSVACRYCYAPVP